jgi:hypothetical protein
MKSENINTINNELGPLTEIVKTIHIEVIVINKPDSFLGLKYFLLIGRGESIPGKLCFLDSSSLDFNITTNKDTDINITIAKGSQIKHALR